MGRVVAVANQKGGVAKTTTVHTIGAAVAARGLRVLLVDLDPQACLTYANGVDPDALELSLHDVMIGRAQARDVLVKHGDLHLLPATIDGEAAGWLPANVINRALRLPAGEHIVRWQYQTPGLRLGVALSALALLLMLAIAASLARSGPRQHPTK